MTQYNGNYTSEVGISDQPLRESQSFTQLPPDRSVVYSYNLAPALIAERRQKNFAYIVTAISMIVTAGLVIALVLVLTRSDNVVETTTEGCTEGPTTSSTTTTSTPDPGTTESTTTTPTTPTTPPPIPPDQQISIDEINNGLFTPKPFNGSLVSGHEILYKNPNLELVLYDIESGNQTVLVGNASVPLQESSRFTELAPDRSRVVYSYNVAPIYRHSFLARYSLVDLTNNGLESDIVPPGLNETELPLLQNFLWGPSGSACAYVYKNNIYYQSDVTSTPQQITTTGEVNVIYHGTPDWVYEEEVFSSHSAIWFSPDGSRMAYATFDDTNVEIMKVPHFGDPVNLTYQYTRHNEIHYPKAGSVNPTVSVTMVDLSATPGPPTVITQPADLVQPILRNVRFINANTVAVMWANRVQTTVVVDLCSQGATTCNRIYEYTQTDGWIDNIPMIFNNDGNAFITILPLVQDFTKKQIVQVTSSGSSLMWTIAYRITRTTVLEILHWSPENTIWFKGINENDFAEQHIYSVNSAGDVSCFTCGIVLEGGRECLYNDGSISTDGTTVIVNCAGPGVPNILIYSVNGTLLKTWEDNADIQELVSRKYIPEIARWHASVAPGFPVAAIHIHVPQNFYDRVNVPLLVYVHGAPGTALVTKKFNIDWGTSLVTRWNIAVAHIDGRGSPTRGTNNTFALHRRLGTDEIDDQISVTRYLQQQLHFVDANRTCIWGWSYGGYAASLALARGGSVFRCAAAVAPVVDWRFHNTIYTERYMDQPQDNEQGYTSSSLLSNDVVAAYRDKRYFLIHGTADDNVDYQHTMLLSKRLQQEDVFFTQMSYTDEDHGLAGVRPHLYHALENFLSENML